MLIIISLIRKRHLWPYKITLTRMDTSGRGSLFGRVVLFSLAQFSIFGTSILKPDFNLSRRQAKYRSELGFSSTRYILTKIELSLQLGSL